MSRKRKSLPIANYNQFALYKLKPTTSKLEKKFEKEVMKKLGFEYEKQFKVGGKSYDFAYPQYKILIEVDGDYWHGKNGRILSSMQKKNRHNDKEKDGLALDNKFKLIRFREKDINTRISKVRLRLTSLIMSKK